MLCKLRHKLLLALEVAQNLAVEILVVRDILVEEDNLVVEGNLAEGDIRVEEDIQVEGGNLGSELSMEFLTMIYVTVH